jgi:hypothetical protein
LKRQAQWLQGWVWWLTSVIIATGGQRFEVNLGKKLVNHFSTNKPGMHLPSQEGRKIK